MSDHNRNSREQSFLPLSVPTIRGNAASYVQQCLDTNWVSSAGPFVDRFENELRQYVGTRHAVATSSGTAALHLALLACGVQPDDEVLVSTLTFVASANTIRYAQAHPVFIDAEPQHWQMDVDLVREFLRTQCDFEDGIVRNRRSGRIVRAIMPVHILGHPVDMQPLMALARRYNLRVIEDAAESLGASYHGRMVGTIGDVGCFSFNGNKTITTGGGGMVVTNDTYLAHRIRHLSTQAKSDPLEYIHDEVGYNYRMPNILAALGCAQLECLPTFLAAKRGHYERYLLELQDVPGIRFQAVANDVNPTYWLTTIQIAAEEFGRNRRELSDALHSRQIQTRPLWQPMHASPVYQEAEAISNGVADRLVAQGLSLPSSSDLTWRDVVRVTNEIYGLVRRAAA